MTPDARYLSVPITIARGNLTTIEPPGYMLNPHQITLVREDGVPAPDPILPTVGRVEGEKVRLLPNVLPLFEGVCILDDDPEAGYELTEEGKQRGALLWQLVHDHGGHAAMIGKRMRVRIEVVD